MRQLRNSFAGCPHRIPFLDSPVGVWAAAGIIWIAAHPAMAADRGMVASEAISLPTVVQTPSAPASGSPTAAPSAPEGVAPVAPLSVSPAARPSSLASPLASPPATPIPAVGAGVRSLSELYDELKARLYQLKQRESGRSSGVAAAPAPVAPPSPVAQPSPTASWMPGAPSGSATGEQAVPPVQGAPLTPAGSPSPSVPPTAGQPGQIGLEAPGGSAPAQAQSVLLEPALETQQILPLPTDHPGQAGQANLHPSARKTMPHSDSAPARRP